MLYVLTPCPHILSSPRTGGWNNDAHDATATPAGGAHTVAGGAHTVAGGAATACNASCNASALREHGDVDLAAYSLASHVIERRGSRDNVTVLIVATTARDLLQEGSDSRCRLT